MNNIKKANIAILTIVSLVITCGCMFLSAEHIYAETDQTGYTVKYMEQGTENQLLEDKIVTDVTMGEKVIEIAPEVEGFTLSKDKEREFVAGKESTIIFYYMPDRFSTVVPSEDGKTRGIDKPDYKKIWNISKDGEYNLDCYVYANNIYTNYYFTGAKSYQIRIRNFDTKKLRVTARRDIVQLEEVTILPNSTMTFFVDTKDTSEKFYLQFYSYSSYVNTEGWIKKFQ